MTNNFTQTSVSMSSKRTYVTPIANITAFSAVIAAFEADTSIGLTKKEKKSESYKAPVKFFDTLGEQKGTLVLTAESTAAYDEAMAMLSSDQDLNDVIAGDGGEASDDETEALWSVRFSCELGGDTFSVTINRTYATVSGYSNAETMAALETWFDNNVSVA